MALCDRTVCLQRLEDMSATDFKHLAVLFVEAFGRNSTPSPAIPQFLKLDFFKVTENPSIDLSVSNYESFKATIESWEETYMGEAHKELRGYMRKHMEESKKGATENY
ncbi:hypothetical protein EW145_g6552, partial [Phellinidium pouzarii]